MLRTYGQKQTHFVIAKGFAKMTKQSQFIEEIRGGFQERRRRKSEVQRRQPSPRAAVLGTVAHSSPNLPLAALPPLPERGSQKQTHCLSSYSGLGTPDIRCSRSVTKRTQTISGSAGVSFSAIRCLRRLLASLSPRYLRRKANFDLDILTVVMAINSQSG